MFKIIDGGTKPHIKTEFSSSADLCAREKVVIGAGETKIIPLGVKIDLEFFREKFKTNYADDGTHGNDFSSEALRSQLYRLMDYEMFLKSHFFELKLRSSLAVKKGLIISNGVGEIDIDYPDEIGLIVHNPVKVKQYVENGCNYTVLEDIDDSEVIIEAGERVAQIKLMPHQNYLMPDEYKSTEKRTGGFGSTNK